MIRIQVSRPVFGNADGSVSVPALAPVGIPVQPIAVLKASAVPPQRFDSVAQLNAWVKKHDAELVNPYE